MLYLAPPATLPATLPDLHPPAASSTPGSCWRAAATAASSRRWRRRRLTRAAAVIAAVCASRPACGGEGAGSDSAADSGSRGWGARQRRASTQAPQAQHAPRSPSRLARARRVHRPGTVNTNSAATCRLPSSSCVGSGGAVPACAAAAAAASASVAAWRGRCTRLLPPLAGAGRPAAGWDRCSGLRGELGAPGRPSRPAGVLVHPAKVAACMMLLNRVWRAIFRPQSASMLCHAAQFFQRAA